MVKLFFTPSCCFTWYQMALNRALKKSHDKIKRELEIGTLLKKVRDSNSMCLSFEQFEVFKGLKKKIKNGYPNVINVSLDTQQSIQEEEGDPFKPAAVPYLRKRSKST